MMLTDGKELSEPLKALPPPERKGTGHASTVGSSVEQRGKFESTADIVAAARQEVAKPAKQNKHETEEQAQFL